MPYNYLVDPKIRENYKIDFENSVIIYDEAHTTLKQYQKTFKVLIWILECLIKYYKNYPN